MENPLLNLTGLPPFSRIRPEHVEPAIDQLLAYSRSAVQRLLLQKAPLDWHNLIQPLEQLEDYLGRAWSPVSHMRSWSLFGGSPTTLGTAL